jgi:hypothetical protein
MARRKKPEELVINHGEFIKNGLTHIIDELKRKPDSNRALYSLISQDHINNSCDKPIPSFMIFQCATEDKFLYCTVYFRALEVSNFLRINLEEIRLNICEILNHYQLVLSVRLSILAFIGYNSPDQIPLERCEIDLYSSLKISHLYKDNPRLIPELLEKMAKATTVIDVTGLKAIKEWLDLDSKEMSLDKLNSHKIINLINKAIDTAENLSCLRNSSSHSAIVVETTQKYVQYIKDVADEFRLCH